MRYCRSEDVLVVGSAMVAVAPSQYSFFVIGSGVHYSVNLDTAVCTKLPSIASPAYILDVSYTYHDGILTLYALDRTVW